MKKIVALLGIVAFFGGSVIAKNGIGQNTVKTAPATVKQDNDKDKDKDKDKDHHRHHHRHHHKVAGTEKK